MGSMAINGDLECIVNSALQYLSTDVLIPFNYILSALRMFEQSGGRYKYLVACSKFGVGTCTVYGYIHLNPEVL
jgi:hypothetical protein